MNWKAILNPWSEIARLECELSYVREESAGWERIYWRDRKAHRQTRDELAEARARIADLEAFKARYDQPRVGGRFARKVKA